jgi:hypothetical protein
MVHAEAEMRTGPREKKKKVLRYKTPNHSHQTMVYAASLRADLDSL